MSGGHNGLSSGDPAEESRAAELARVLINHAQHLREEWLRVTRHSVDSRFDEGLLFR
jgi:hypothetical protein